MTHRLWWAGLAALLCAGSGALRPLADPAAASAAQAPREAQSLSPGLLLDGTLRGGEGRAFVIDLDAGDFLHIVVEQRGADVGVRLTGPDGTELTSIDSPNSTDGPEPLVWISSSTGTYRIDVTSLFPPADATARSF